MFLTHCFVVRVTDTLRFNKRKRALTQRKQGRIGAYMVVAQMFAAIQVRIRHKIYCAPYVSAQGQTDKHHPSAPDRGRGGHRVRFR
jgi:hypothetical protein